MIGTIDLLFQIVIIFSTNFYCLVKNQDLSYYQSENDVKPSGPPLSLTHALVSNLTVIKERAYSFSVQLFTPSRTLVRTVFFSAATEQEGLDWNAAIIEASSSKAGTSARAIFNKVNDDSFVEDQVPAVEEWDERQLLVTEGESREEDDDMFKYYEIDHRNQRILKREGATIGVLNDNNFGGERSRKSSMSMITASNPFKLAQPLSPSRYDEPVEELSDNDEKSEHHRIIEPINSNDEIKNGGISDPKSFQKDVYIKPIVKEDFGNITDEHS